MFTIVQVVFIPFDGVFCQPILFEFSHENFVVYRIAFLLQVQEDHWATVYDSVGSNQHGCWVDVCKLVERDAIINQYVYFLYMLQSFSFAVAKEYLPL